MPAENWLGKRQKNEVAMCMLLHVKIKNSAVKNTNTAS